MREEEQCFSDTSSNIFHHICKTNSRQFVLPSDGLRKIEKKSTVTLRKDTVDVGMKWQDELPQWMEQQLFRSLYNVNSSFVTIVQWALLLHQTSILYSYISSCDYFGHTTQNQQGKMSKAFWHHQKVFWETHRAFPESSLRYTVCWVDKGRDLVMLTLLLKWPPAGLPFTALWWNPVPPFIPTCASQIFKLGLHKHCCAGEMIPNAVWSEPAAL